MENFNFNFNFDSYSFPIQIIKLNGCFFIYVGDSHFSFNNLTLAIQNSENHKNLHSSTIYEDEYSELGKSLSDKLATKLKCPIYLSFNLDDGFLTSNRELYLQLEKGLCDTITSIQK